MQKLLFGIALLALCSPAKSENWPQFRGPTGQGLSSETDVPSTWNFTENVAWKKDVLGAGWSSPICWGDCVFVTTAVQDGVSYRAIALNCTNGATLWDKEVARQNIGGRKEGRNSYATPTPATDGSLIYVVLFDGWFSALDFNGTVIWENKDYPFYSQHGLGTSPILWNDLLIMARDGSSESGDKRVGWQIPWDKSFLVALDKHTGKERWKAPRGLSRIGHVVPVVWTNAEGIPFIISAAGDVVQGFSAASGDRVWTSHNKGEGVVPSLATGEGLVYAACGFSGRDSIKAFRLNGRGDLRETNLVWEQKKNMPHIPSLLYVTPFLYSVSDTGMAMCLQGNTGEVRWQHNLGGSFSASPIYAAGKIYFLSDDGETTVLQAGADYRLISKNPLNEKCQASPAVFRKHLFIRTEHNLFCIGDKW